MRHSFASGIGQFLFSIGVAHAGSAVVPGPPAMIDTFRDCKAQRALAGFIRTAVIMNRHFRGAILSRLPEDVAVMVGVHVRLLTRCRCSREPRWPS
jgi:xanthine/uracil/vitamin C permease (AzgA family)